MKISFELHLALNLIRTYTFKLTGNYGSRISYWLLGLSLLSARFQAQEIKFNKLTSALQIPSECYSVMEDSHGYVWICAEGGLYRFDGKKSNLFNLPKGVTRAPVYCIFEDPQKLVRVITSHNSVLRAQGDSLVEEPWSKVFQSTLNKELYYTYFAAKTSDSCFHFNTNGYSYKLNPHTNELINLSKQKDDEDANFFISTSEEETVLIKKRSFLHTQPTIHIKTENRDTLLKFDFSKALPNGPDYRIRVCRIGNLLFMNMGRLLLKINLYNFSTQVYSFPVVISALCSDRTNGLFLGLFKGGLYYYKDVQHMDRFIHSLTQLSVVSISLDREKGLWCSTTEKGMFYSYSPFVYYFPNQPSLLNPTELLKVYHDTLLLSGDGHILYVFDENHKRITSHKIAFSPGDIIRKNNIWYAGNRSSMQMRLDHNFKHLGYNQNSSFQFAPFKKGIIGLSKRYFYFINGKQEQQVFPCFPSPARSFVLSGDSSFLLGCNNGLYTGEFGKKSIRKISGIDSQVNKVLKDKMGNIWVAASQEGLFLWNGKKLLKLIPATVGKINDIKDMEEGRDNNIWIATSNGLFSVKIDKGGTQIKQYTHVNGLISDDIRQIEVGEKNVYLSTADGICFFDPQDELLLEKEPEIIVKSISINMKERVVNDSFLLKPDENNISLFFDAPGLKQNMRLNPFEILLNGPIKISNRTDKNWVDIYNIPSGNYQLNLWTINNQGKKNDQFLTCNFSVQEVYWKKAWFILIMLILCLVLLGGMLKYILSLVNKKAMKKEETERLILSLQLSALQSQMNPHFIFNAINSIQNFILKEKTREAYNYLSKFGKLIRMVLNNSRESVLTLSQELETINLYIQLEQLRFKEKFEFRLEIDDELAPIEIQIPAMLIQPFLENAIRHGLINLKSERKGLLILKISGTINYLNIVIWDNGIGRKNAQALMEKNTHKPIGLKITNQRLEIIKTMKGYEQTSIDVTDNYDIYGEAIGTIISLKLPLVYIFNKQKTETNLFSKGVIQ